MAKAEEKLFDLTLTGEPAIDFVNTIDWRKSEAPLELLNSCSDLLRWARHTGILSEAEAVQIQNEANKLTEDAEKTLTKAIALRELLFDIFSAVARGEKPAKEDLKSFNQELRRALAHLTIVEEEGNFVWRWESEKNDLENLLWEIVRLAAELLTSGRLKDLRECPGAGCAWLFVDTSRNKARRWCTMEICGNRAKAKRHYEKAKNN